MRQSIRVGDVEVIALITRTSRLTSLGMGRGTGRTILSSLMRMATTGHRGISAAT
jgi:hypothetical protein